LWVILIDIWASTTWISVYEEWILIHSAIIPFWWDNVTNDIALWTRTSIEVAEKLKLDYTTLSSENVKIPSKTIKLSKISEHDDWEVELEYLSQIATARYEEILEFINEELRRIWKESMLPEWAVFVWASSKIKWLTELSKDVLKLPSFVWNIQVNDELIDKTVSDPSYAAIIWNMILANKYWDNYHRFSIDFSQILGSLKKILKKIMPK
jgi:cell division protein FtsA